MAILDIIEAPDPRLKKLSKPVKAVDDALRRLMDDMVETMHAANGIGLAAAQVGVHKRVLVIQIDDDEGEAEMPPMHFANPEIVWTSDDELLSEEGCLSLPEHFAEVSRPERIRVRYLDYQNEIRELEADGLLAKCIQHEMDHLDGVLFVDHLSALKRRIILRKLAKVKRAQQPAAV